MESAKAQWRKLKENYQTRRAVFERLWMPIGLPLSVVTVVISIYEFVRTHGALSVPLAGLLLLLLLVLLAAPVRAIRVFALRILAFVMDVVLLGVGTFMILWLLRLGGDKFGGPALMVVAWLWFWYFVFFDYWFRGTLGKRLFGLRLVSEAQRLSFLVCFLRASLSLLVPIISATTLSDALSPTASPFRYFAATAARQAVLAFIPISILLFGGNRGIVDRFLRTDVVPLRTNARSTVIWRSEKAWLVLCLSSIVWGTVFAWLSYLAYGRLQFGGSPKPAISEHMIQYWQVDKPETIAKLWQVLPTGLRDPTAIMSNIQIRAAYPNPFRIDTSSSHTPIWSKEFQEQQEVQIIRISFHPGASLLSKMLVMSNLAELMASQATTQSEPRYFVVQMGTEGDFGVFFTESYETFLLRAAGVNTSYLTLQPNLQLGARSSLDRVRWLLLGDWNSLPRLEIEGEYH